MSDLRRWLGRPKRKPLVLRGARQVGKSYVVREFARSQKLGLVELNFERDPKAAKLFAESDPRGIVRAIEAFANQRLHDRASLLFLDEIQAAPEVFAKLRWLAEELPNLPVVAAGSLLDFVLADHAFSMPVGRISYLHLEPMSFAEFLEGLGETELAELLHEIDPARGLLEPLHERLLGRFREYVLVGGMPEAVETYRQSGSLIECARVHHDLLATYRDDFAKYATGVQRQRLIKVLDCVPRFVGQKFVYSRVDRDERAATLRQAVEMLCLARVCHRVRATHATGVPLGAQADDRHFKLILLDVGLLSAALRLSLVDLQRAADLVLANEGAIAEQVVGQALRLVDPSFQEPSLYYWAREARGAEAEVDYVVPHGKRIVPVEVKAGATGGLRSLHVLMALRKWKRAFRFNADRPSITRVSAGTKVGARADYELVSLPLYLAAEAGRIQSSF